MNITSDLLIAFSIVVVTIQSVPAKQSFDCRVTEAITGTTTGS
jgi:hypothetical protein